jgi:hypothetical protein
MTPKAVHIVGGGTVSYLASHIQLASSAKGTTARRLAELCIEEGKQLAREGGHPEPVQPSMDVELHLTKEANPMSLLATPDDLRGLAERLAADRRTKIVFWTPSVLDFAGTIEGIEPGKYSRRPRALNAADNPQTYTVTLTGIPKILDVFRRNGAGRQPRKDVFLVAFKQSAGESAERQYWLAMELLKRTSANLVFANDSITRRNMIVVPEEACYPETEKEMYDRDTLLRRLVHMAYMRSHLTFTHSTVVAGEPVPWDSPCVPPVLRSIVDHCIAQGAYKPVSGATAGHFAAKIGDREFLTSIRKSDFRKMKNIGLVRVTTDGPDKVLAYGARPSVGGQSQRIVFEDHPEHDCIVHFHCPKRPGSLVPTVSQEEYECGSHECGKNTSNGLRKFGNLSAVFLDQHGPNIVFNHSIDPAEVIRFIEENFDLSKKTGGFQLPAAS